MSASMTTTPDALYVAILGTLAALYGDRFGSYAPYDPATLLYPGAQLPDASLWLEIASGTAYAEAAAAKSRGRTAIDLTMTLHAVLSTGLTDIQLALDRVAASLVALLREPSDDPRMADRPGPLWGLGLAALPPERVAFQEVDWGLQGYGMRSVSWDQTVFFPTDPLACLLEN